MAMSQEKLTLVRPLTSAPQPASTYAPRLQSFTKGEVKRVRQFYPPERSCRGVGDLGLPPGDPTAFLIAPMLLHYLVVQSHDENRRSPLPDEMCSILPTGQHQEKRCPHRRNGQAQIDA